MPTRLMTEDVVGITSSTGLASGINYDQLVSQVQDAARQPILRLQAKQVAYQQQISGLLSLSTKVSTLLAVATSVNNPANFNTKTASVTKTSTGNSLLSASTDSTATNGIYSLTVLQLAQAAKMASQGVADQNISAIAGGAGTFQFKVGSTGTVYSVTVDATTTLQGLRDAINSSGGSVTASIVNAGAGSTPYRLVLTANTPGAANAITITNNNTTLDFTNKKVEAAYAATTNSFAGTVSSNAGNTYTGTTNKTFLVKMVSAGAAGVATYKYSIDGGMTYLGFGGAAYSSTAGTGTAGAGIVAPAALTAVDGNATANEGVQIAFGAGTLAVGDAFTVNVYNPTLQAAQDAVMKIDNTTVTRSSNTITDALQGVTLNLTQVDATNSVTLNVASDTSGLSDKIKNFVNSYNDVTAFLADQLKYDPQTKKAGTLLADSSLRAVQRVLKNVISGSIPGLITGKMNLSQIGITSDSKTGKLTVNDGVLGAAISSDPDGVKRLFLGIGTPSNTAISFSSLTDKTSAGTYGINITVAPMKAALGGSSDVTMTNISSTGLTNPEVLSFTYSNNYTAASPTTTSFNVSLTAGSKINDVVSALNSAFATQKVGLSASNDNLSGKLKITSTDYGKDIRFTVASDQGGATQTGIGTTMRTAQGVDIAGTINNHPATGTGKVLSSSSGFAENGLSISSETSSTGLFGTIAVSRGVGDQLVAKLGSFTDPKSGIFTAKTTGLQGSIDQLSKSIDKINKQATNEGDRLRKQLVRLESIMAQFQASSNYLTNQMSKLPSFSTGLK
ncbi:MAG: hypothetical protein EPO64_03005 [Nitrospirae bacterium]|nr:MAG: hypothetical protein EPO64_03005 [Nitrospirota bacterium]